MSRYAVLAVVLGAVTVQADAPRFRFQKGETLAYRVVQTTRVTESVPDEKTNEPVATESVTRVDLVRQWKVADVDDHGVATLEMSIVSLRMERKAGAEEDVFDSTRPDDLNKNEMSRHVGPVLAVVRVDPLGRVVDVKDSKVGPASRFAVELPFKMLLPEDAPKPGTGWDRGYTIQLDPPHGTGEKYAASQKYACKEPQGGFLTVGLATEIKDAPTDPTDLLPLLPMLAEGNLYFHTEAGRYFGARLKTERELKNHQGEGSTYKYVSTYVEDFVPAK